MAEALRGIVYTVAEKSCSNNRISATYIWTFNTQRDILTLKLGRRVGLLIKQNGTRHLFISSSQIVCNLDFFFHKKFQ